MSQPYTITFGPWLPDLQDVGIQMSFQYSATPFPLADCLNVYYADAAYRSIPGPAAIGPSLGVPITNAYDWYDDSTGKQEVFAATANGIYVLIDGTWTAVPIQINNSQVAAGQLMQFTLGAPLYANYAISPSSQTGTGVPLGYTFSAEAVVVGAGTVTAHNWYFGTASGPGSWSIASGQGTASAVAAFSGGTSGAVSSNTFKCDVTINGTIYTVSAALSYEPTFAPVQHLYTNVAAGTETIPTGAAQVVIEGWGSGGPGGNGHGTGCLGAGGGGGGSGGYFKKTVALTSGNWGQTISYSDTLASLTPQNTTVSSGTFTLSTLTGYAGNVGNAATSNFSAGTGGTGGAATGGDVDTTGNTGGTGTTSAGGGPSGGSGATGVTGAHAGPYGAGSGGAAYNGAPHGNGYAGAVSFYYS